MRPETESWIGYQYRDGSGGSFLSETDGFGDLGGRCLLEEEDGSATRLEAMGRRPREHVWWGDGCGALEVEGESTLTRLMRELRLSPWS